MTAPASPFPSGARERAAWIVARRPPRRAVDPTRANGAFVEEEPGADGCLESVAVVLLAGAECAWKCLHCDLWRETLPGPTPAGALPAQIERALAELPSATTLKLYNASSFFDPRAVPPDDLAPIARLASRFERVVVECHPALVGDSALAFRDLLRGRLEVALGLETIHPEVLPRLGKRMSLDRFRGAVRFLRDADIDVRAFVLVGLPFVDDDAVAADWAVRSAAFAFESGVQAVSLVPLRTGNGALDAVDAREPSLAAIDAALAGALALGRGRVFADLWDLERFARCPACRERRIARIRRACLEQRCAPEAARCPDCSLPPLGGIEPAR